MERGIRLSVRVQSVICPTLQLKLFQAGLVVEIDSTPRHSVLILLMI